MKRLLVPIDFSPESVNAFRFALDIADQSHGRIHLLHVISQPVLHDSPLIPVGALKKEILGELEAEALKKIERMNDTFNTRGARMRPHIVSGRVHATIIAFTQKENIDLVVMGTRGAEGIKEWTIGSNTEKIVRTSPVPIIAVKHYQAGYKIKHIVFPTTPETTNQEELVMKIKSLQDFYKATLHIIWVNTPALFKPDLVIRKELNAFAGRFMLKDYTINVFSYTDEESGILEFTKQVNGDLIAMGTHGLRGIAHLINGSVAEDVVNHVHYPVWTYCTRSANKYVEENKLA